MKHVCDNCGTDWHIDSLEEIKDYSMRVDPGGAVPSGQCPDCGALCYPQKGNKGKKKDYTVVGYWYDNAQIFVDHVRANNAKDALRKASNTDNADNKWVVEVFEGKHYGLGKFDTTTCLADMFEDERPE